MARKMAKRKSKEALKLPYQGRLPPREAAVMLVLMIVDLSSHGKHYLKESIIFMHNYKWGVMIGIVISLTLLALATGSINATSLLDRVFQDWQHYT